MKMPIAGTVNYLIFNYIINEFLEYMFYFTKISRIFKAFHVLRTFRF